MMWHDGGWGWGAWFGMGMLMLVFWALVAVVVVTLVRRTGEHPPMRVGHEDAMAVLDRRFATGEIDEAEYRARREVLRSG